MLTIIVRKMVLIIKFVLTVLLILLILPRIAQASCGAPVTEDRVNISTMIEGCRELAEIECATYRSTVFLEEEIPIKLLGIHLSTVTVIQSAEGTVTASVDLSGLGGEDVTAGENSVTIRLPGPLIACTDVIPTWSIHPRSIPVGAAEDLALVEDAMAEEARTLLSQQALENGLLDEARLKLKHQVTQIVRNTGYDGDVILQFRN